MTEAPNHLPAFWLAPSPGAIYVQNGHALRLAAYSSLAGVTLVLEGLLLTLEGRIETVRQELAPTSDRVITRVLAGIREGWLLAGHVRAIGGTPRMGRVYARVELVLGRTGDVLPIATLAQGYVTETTWLTWPFDMSRNSVEGRGAVRTYLGTDPAAGVEVSETVPTGARWRVIAFNATLTADATVANRTPAITIDDGTSIVWQAGYNGSIAASGGAAVAWGHGAGAFGSTGNGAISPLPTDMILAAGYRVRTSTSGLQAGDNWGQPKYLVEEWIEA